MKWKMTIKGIVVALASVAIGWWFGVSAGLLWFLFLIFLVYAWDSRVIGVLALLALAACPVLQILKKDDLKETAAVYAFFFLTMTVGLEIADLVRPTKEEKEEEAKVVEPVPEIDAKPAQSKAARIALAVIFVLLVYFGLMVFGTL